MLGQVLISVIPVVLGINNTDDASVSSVIKEGMVGTMP